MTHKRTDHLRLTASQSAMTMRTSFFATVFYYSRVCRNFPRDHRMVRRQKSGRYFKFMPANQAPGQYTVCELLSSLIYASCQLVRLACLPYAPLTVVMILPTRLGTQAESSATDAPIVYVTSLSPASVAWPDPLSASAFNGWLEMVQAKHGHRRGQAKSISRSLHFVATLVPEAVDNGRQKRNRRDSGGFASGRPLSPRPCMRHVSVNVCS